MQGAIDEDLVNRRGVSESEWHNQIFKVSEWGVKSSFPFIPLLDAGKMIEGPIL